jgi:hypothetical protein
MREDPASFSQLLQLVSLSTSRRSSHQRTSGFVYNRRQLKLLQNTPACPYPVFVFCQLPSRHLTPVVKLLLVNLGRRISDVLSVPKETFFLFHCISGAVQQFK